MKDDIFFLKITQNGQLTTEILSFLNLTNEIFEENFKIYKEKHFIVTEVEHRNPTLDINSVP